VSRIFNRYPEAGLSFLMHLTERSIFEKQGGTAEFSAPGEGRFFYFGG